MRKKLNRFLKVLIAAIYFFLSRLYSNLCELMGSKTPRTLVVVTYHAVRPEQKDKFKRQMSVLVNMGQPTHLGIPLPASGKNNYIAVTFDDAYRSVMENALPILISKKIPATIFVPTGALGQKPTWIKDTQHPFANETVMTSEEIQKLPSELVTIGSHTVTHKRLSSIDTSTFRQELTESKKSLESILGKEIHLISVPYGSFDISATNLFEEAGYKHVFLNIPGQSISELGSFISGRISVDPDDTFLEYRLKLSGAYQWLPWAIRFKRILLLKNH